MPDIHTFEPLWGEWRTVRTLGQGSYGTVYLAEKVELNQHYYSAIKYISIPANAGQTEELYSEGVVTDEATLHQYYEQVRDALMAEIAINNRLKGNTNIVSYEEHKVIPRTNEPGYDIFIKMELLTSLTNHIREKDLTTGDVVRLGRDICTALEILQREKIIHRDIKPANIFVHSSGHFKLGDFGVARTMEKTVSNMSVKGTFAFMAPEVAKGGEGDYRVDICSLGLVLYRLLNGNRGPFLPPPPAVVTYADNEQAQRLRMKGESLPPPALADDKLAAIVLKACAFRPEDRYPDAARFRTALAEYEAGMTAETAGRVVLNRIGGTQLFSGSGGRDFSAGTRGKKTEKGVSAGVDAAAEERTSILTRDTGCGESTVLLLQGSQAAESAQQFPGGGAGEETVFLPRESEGEETVFLSREGEEETVFLPQEGEETVFLPWDDEEEKPLQPDDEATIYLPENEEHEETVFLPQTGEEAVPPEEETVFLTEEAADGEAGASALLKPVSSRKGRKLALLAGAVVVLICGMAVIGAMHRESPAVETSPPTPAVVLPEETPEPDFILADEGVAASVRAALGLAPGEELRPEMLERVEILRMGAGTGVAVTTLEDLVGMSGLKVLDISGQPVEDYGVLTELEELTSLNLGGCSLGDGAFLKELPRGLENLDLRETGLTALDFAAGLERLSYLNISGNGISDLTPLAGLDRLAVLEAEGNPVADWSAVDAVASVSGRPEMEENTPTPAPASTPPVSSPRPTVSARPTATVRPAASSANTPAPTPAATPTPAPVKASVSVSPGNMLMDVGDSQSLSVSVSPEDVRSELKFSSDNTGVATVSSSGRVTAVGPGKAVITVSGGGASGVCTVSVS